MWSYFLYGMVIVQVCRLIIRLVILGLTMSADMYCEAFPRDRLGIKALGMRLPFMEMTYRH
jgi:hypothetical protein